MGGELHIDIKEIRINETDLTFVSRNGDYLHICGDNDLLKLIKEAKKSDITYYYNRIVEIRYPDYEFKRFGKGLGEYPRATIHNVDNRGVFTLYALHDNKKYEIYGGWLYDIKENKMLDMSKYEKDLPF